MTIIVGLQHAGGVVMGADSISTDGTYCSQRDGTTRKLFRKGPYLIGYTTSFRLGDLLRFEVRWPAPPKRRGDAVLYRHMVSAVVPAIRAAFAAGGAVAAGGAEQGAELLIAVSGRLFRIGRDHHVAGYLAGYATCGCGEDIANGALHATAGLDGLEPRRRVRLALHAAAAHCVRARGPFFLMEQTR